MTLVAPSILSADFAAVERGIRKIEESAGDWVHLDVMDGSFVPQITFGAKMVADLRPLTRLPFDVHLMVNHPETHVEAFAQAGAERVTVHCEASVHLHRLLQHMASLGLRPGVSIVPSTPVVQVEEVLPFLDLVLVMTVNPGFGGQELIPQTLEKVRALRRIRAGRGLSFLIEVDGGINEHTASTAVSAGADVLVTGSSFFHSDAPARYIEALKGVR
jgi:ribulose-phosphate 3-epimerase